MAHRSWCAENDGTESNERLEFLGDAVLGWVIADIAFRQYRDLPEVDLTRHVGERHRVDDALAEVGERSLGEFGEPAEHEIGDHPPEDGVAEELEAFVADDLVG